VTNSLIFPALPPVGSPDLYDPAPPSTALVPSKSILISGTFASQISFICSSVKGSVNSQ